MLTGTLETDESESSSILEREPIKIVVESKILSVAFLADGQHFVSGDNEGMIRCWQVEDGEQAGVPMDAWGAVHSIAVSPDGKWIVAGTKSGHVVVWNAESRRQVRQIHAHNKVVNAVDVSPDGTKIATLDDKHVRVWSLLDSRQLFGRAAKSTFQDMVKFSPDGSRVVVASVEDESVPASLAIHDGQDGNFLNAIQLPVRSVAWASNSKHLFALSSANSHIHHFDTWSRATLSKWPIHSTDKPRCISLSSNGAFIAACANSSVSFWDTTTYQQIGCVIHHPDFVDCMALSLNDNLVIAGSSSIALWDMRHVISTPYIDDQVCRFSTPWIVSSICFCGRNRNTTKYYWKRPKHASRKQSLIPLCSLMTQPDKAVWKTPLNHYVPILRCRTPSPVRSLSIQVGALLMVFWLSVDLEKTVEQLRSEITDSQLNVESMLRAHEQKHGAYFFYPDMSLPHCDIISGSREDCPRTSYTAYPLPAASGWFRQDP